MTGNSWNFAPATDTCCMGERGFRADVHNIRTLSRQNFSAGPRFRRQADAFAIPRVGRKIDDAMMAGRELKFNFLPPAENSITRADARRGCVRVAPRDFPISALRARS